MIYNVIKINALCVFIYISSSGYANANNPGCIINNGVISGSCDYSGTSVLKEGDYTVKNYPGTDPGRNEGGIYVEGQNGSMTINDNTLIDFIVDPTDKYKYGYLFNLGSKYGEDNQILIVKGHKQGDKYSITLTSNNGNLIDLSNSGFTDHSTASMYIEGAKMILNNDVNNDSVAGISITGTTESTVDKIADSYIVSNVNISDLSGYGNSPIIQIMTGNQDTTLQLNNTQIDSNGGQEVLYSAGGNFSYSNGIINYKNPSEKAGLVFFIGGTAGPSVDGNGGIFSVSDSIINVNGGSGTAFVLGSQSSSTPDASKEPKVNISHSNINIQDGWYGFKMNAGTEANITNNSTINTGNGSVFLFSDQHWGGSYSFMDKFRTIVNLIDSKIKSNGSVFDFYGANPYNDSDSSINSDVKINNSNVYAGVDLINADAKKYTNNNGEIFNYNIDFTLSAINNSTLSGDIIVKSEEGSSANAIIDLDNSALTGTSLVAGDNATLDMKLDHHAVWNMTGNSSLSSLTLSNDSKVILSDANNFGSGNTLTVKGNYLGDNGLLIFNGVLEGDNSPIDKLVINGNTAGVSSVSVHNLGGRGAQTIEGISLIDVEGDSDGDFKKSGRIVAGAYDYDLIKKGTNWYLSSSLPTPTPTPETHMVRPETGSYIANLQAANTLFSLSLHDRNGEERYTNAENDRKAVTSMWMRNEGGHNRFSGSDGQNDTQSNRYVLQIGGDIGQWTFDGNDSYRLGVMGGYANQHSNTLNKQTGYKSTGQINGYSTGIYSTWYQNAVSKRGLYIDGWMQYAWFNNEIKGEDIAPETYNSKGLTASLESGYTFQVSSWQTVGGMNNSFYLQPHIQVSWAGVKADNHREEEGTQVQQVGSDNVRTLLGMRAYLNGKSVLDKGNSREFQPFVETNWIHNLKEYGVSMDGQNYAISGSRNIGEIKAGVEGRLTNNLAGWIGVAQQVGGKGYSDTQGTLSIRYKF